MATRYFNPFVTYLTPDAAPASGHKFYFYEVGTNTPKTIYSDAGAGTALDNPQTADERGQLTDIFLDGSYKIVWQDRNGATVKEIAAFSGDDTGQWALWDETQTYSQTNLVQGSDGKYYTSITDNNFNNDPTTSATNWMEVILIFAWNTNYTYAIGDIAQGSDGELYRAVISQSGNNPVSDDGTNWLALSPFTVGDVVLSGDFDKYPTPAWLPCNGSSYNETTYAALLAKIGKAPIEIAFGGTTTSNPTEMQYAPSGTYLAISGSSSLNAYKRVGDVYSDLTSNMPSAYYESVCWSSDGVWLVGGRTNTPFIQICKRSGDTFTLQSNPATLPSTHGYSVAFDNTDTYLLVGEDNGTFELYSRSGDVFTSITAPSSISGDPRDMSAHPTADYFAIAATASPYVIVLKGNGAGSYSKISDPADLPANAAYGVSWNNDGTKLAVANITTSPYLTVYSFDSGTDTLTKLADPDILPASGLIDLVFSPDGSVLTCIPQTAGSITQYDVGASTLTYKRLITPDAGSMNAVDYSPDGEHIGTAGTNGGSNNTIYKNSAVTPDIDGNIGDYELARGFIKTGL